MGCTSSKRIEATVADVYKPLPSSFAVFDVNSIQEPWLTSAPEEEQLQQQQQQKPPPTTAGGGRVPNPILEKINKFENIVDAPRSWDEVSKALEKDLKPIPKPNQPASATSEALKLDPPQPAALGAPRKSFSFHTLEELDAKLSSNKTPENNKVVKKTESMRTELKKTTTTNNESAPAESPLFNKSNIIKSVKENPFIVRDRMEREKEGKMAAYDRMMAYKRDPLAGYPEKCPPGGENALVVYTTSLRGVRRTHEDCTRVRSILEGHRVVFDERDVSLHGEFLSELKELLGEKVSSGRVGVPRVFLKGRYLGGVEEVVELNESGRLGRMLGWARVERGVGWRACEGCGGARFVPCLVCGGSCKMVGDGGAKQRCGSCNENGLARCPACL